MSELPPLPEPREWYDCYIVEAYDEDQMRAYARQCIEQHEAQWQTWGVIEVAVRNPSVAEYMRHWEGRAEKAEAERDALKADLWWLVGGGEFAAWVQSGVEMTLAAAKEWDEARRHFPQLEDESNYRANLWGK